jgi:alanine-glyoxylate transaminase/serine-glyoxylate transaminase/serine-pyruvate transaminase
MSQTMLSHLDPVFIRVMDDVQEGLRQVFGTRSPITLPISGTGTAGMETAMVNMIEPGDRVLVCTAGYFADRMAEIAGRAGGEVLRLEAPWGRVFEADQVSEAVERYRPRVVAFVHVETSTGTSQPIEPLAEVLNRDDIITIMDCVASLAGEPVDVQGNGLDFVYSGSQKCLSCPPGLAPITLSDKAIRRLSTRTTPVQSWYLDLVMLRKYWSDVRVYHHTAPISLNYALREALRIIEEEGLPNLFTRPWWPASKPWVSRCSWPGKPGPGRSTRSGFPRASTTRPCGPPCSSATVSRSSEGSGISGEKCGGSA